MHGNDCSLVYCNQRKLGRVTPLARTEHRAAVNDCRWRKEGRHRWSHTADIMFILMPVDLMNKVSVLMSLYQVLLDLSPIPQSPFLGLLIIWSIYYCIYLYSTFVQFNRLSTVGEWTVWLQLLKQYLMSEWNYCTNTDVPARCLWGLKRKKCFWKWCNR